MSEMEEREPLERRAAYFTCDIEYEQPSYYFAPADRAPGPYLEQREVRAILDIADDGTLAGVELIWGDLPMPPKASPDSSPLPTKKDE